MVRAKLRKLYKLRKIQKEPMRTPECVKDLYPIGLIVEDVLTAINSYIEQHEVNIQYNRAEDIEVLLNKGLIEHAFKNIIINAVQAMPDGGKLTVSTVYLHGVFVKVVFEDTGEGIKKDNMDKIFNPFYTTKKKSSGLGLLIVQKIIEAHGGAISVLSKEGNGTVFEILLPIR